MDPAPLHSPHNRDGACQALTQRSGAQTWAAEGPGAPRRTPRPLSSQRPPSMRIPAARPDASPDLGADVPSAAFRFRALSAVTSGGVVPARGAGGDPGPAAGNGAAGGGTGHGAGPAVARPYRAPRVGGGGSSRGSVAMWGRTSRETGLLRPPALDEP